MIVIAFARCMQPDKTFAADSKIRGVTLKIPTSPFNSAEENIGVLASRSFLSFFIIFLSFVP